MVQLVTVINKGITCPKCHRVVGLVANLWHRTTMPKGNGTFIIAALCCECTKHGPTRNQIKYQKTIVSTNRAGTPIAVYYNMSLAGWIPALSERLL